MASAALCHVSVRHVSLEVCLLPRVTVPPPPLVTGLGLVALFLFVECVPFPHTHTHTLVRRAILLQFLKIVGDGEVGDRKQSVAFRGDISGFSQYYSD